MNRLLILVGSLAGGLACARRKLFALLAKLQEAIAPNHP